MLLYQLNLEIPKINCIQQGDAMVGCEAAVFITQIAMAIAFLLGIENHVLAKPFVKKKILRFYPSD